MKSFYSLLSEYNSLPTGNIYFKKIYEREYCYHQYISNGKMITKILSYEEAKQMRLLFGRKQILKEEIAELLKSTNRNLKLSNSAREMSGDLMSGDTIVATFDKGILTYIDEKICPLIIKRTRVLNSFLRSRVIDTSRTNARLLKKVLNIKEEDEELISLCSYAASITDNYWFKPRHSKLTYQDVSFDNDIFFDLSLRGLITIYPHKMVLTPDLTTGGSFEKGWKNVDGHWWLYKSETDNEMFSELFYANLLEKLNIPTAHYEYEEGFIKSLNFAENLNYEPIISIVGNDEDYQYVFKELKKIDLDIAKQYLLLIYFDTLLNNVDRHNENYGLLRDQKTGKILSLAPNFDDNLSLIARDVNLSFNPKDGFVRLFTSFINSNRDAALLLKEIIPHISKDILKEVINSIPIKVDDRMIVEYILKKQEHLKTLLDKIN